MSGRMDSRIALITGSDSGIGQATAIEFAKEGADVVVHYLADADGAEETRQGSRPTAATPSSCRPTSQTSTGWAGSSTRPWTSSAGSTS